MTKSSNSPLLKLIEETYENLGLPKPNTRYFDGLMVTESVQYVGGFKQ